LREKAGIRAFGDGGLHRQVTRLLALTSTFGLDFRYFGMTVVWLQGR